MALQCNIDSRGAGARLIMGLLMLGVSVYLSISWFGSQADVPAWMVILLVASFAFSGLLIFQGVTKWCVLKALIARFKPKPDAANPNQ